MVIRVGNIEMLSDGKNDDEIIKKYSDFKRQTIDIIKESITQNKVFDLEILNYNESIITSAETDTAVLLTSTELIKLLISGNQCVVMDADTDDVYAEDINVYK